MELFIFTYSDGLNIKMLLVFFGPKKLGSAVFMSQQNHPMTLSIIAVGPLTFIRARLIACAEPPTPSEKIRTLPCRSQRALVLATLTPLVTVARLKVPAPRECRFPTSPRELVD